MWIAKQIKQNLRYLLSNPFTESLNALLSQQSTSVKKTKPSFQWDVYKKLLSYAYKQTTLLFFSITLLLGTSGLMAYLPQMVGQTLDKITQAQYNVEAASLSMLAPDPRQIRISYTQHVVILLVLIIMTFLRVMCTDLLQERIAIALRVDIFKKFIYNDMKFFEIYKGGELNSRLVDDVDRAKSAVSLNITFLIRHLLTILWNIFTLYFINSRLTFLVLLIVPVYVKISLFYHQKTKRLTKQKQEINAEMSNLSNEVFSGIHITKAFCGETFEIEKYSQINNRGYKIAFQSVLNTAIFVTSTIVLPNIGIFLVLYYGGGLVINKEGLTAGDLTSFILSCATLSNGATTIASSYANILNGTSTIQKVFEMMEYEPEIEQRSDPFIDSTTLKGQIQFKNVEFKYPHKDPVVIKQLNLKIHSGEYVAFVGQSGSGKSTLVKLIQRFYELKSGSLMFDGIDCKKLTVNTIRSQIGFVSQEAILFEGTIRDNIAYGTRSYTEEELIEVCEKSGCLEFIKNKQVFPEGLQTRVGEKGGQLSGGQRQRISIARALMKKPKILIFDEATSALDSNSQYIVQQTIETLVCDNKNRITIIVIAHRLSTVINAQRILVFQQGEIVEHGSHDNLLSREGYYSTLVEKQLKRTISKIESTKEIIEAG